jgi:hypothetical protein
MSATDQEIFDSATAAEPTPILEQTEKPPVEAAEATTEVKPERDRDDKGRYVPKAPEAAQEVVKEPVTQPQVEIHPEAKREDTETDARVPSWRLAEESSRRREAEQNLAAVQNEIRQMQMQLAQMRQPQAQAEPVDPFADPQGFAQSIQGSFEAKLKEMQLQQSLQFARFAHKDVFDEAYSAFVDHAHKTRDQATYQRVMSSSDPGEALVSWFKERQTLNELGGTDVNAWLEKKREEWLKDPATQAKVIEAFKATQGAAQPNSSITQIPPSLSKVTAAQQAYSEDGDASGQGVYNYAKKR